MSKKIVYIAPANSLHSFRWIQHFIGLNYNILWISFHKIEEKFLVDYPSLKIVVLDKEHENLLSKNPFLIFFSFFKAIFKVKNLVRKFNGNLAQVHSFGLYGIFASFTHNLPTVGTVWGSDILFISNPFKEFLIKRALKKCNFVTCDAFHMTERLNQLGIDNSYIKLIYFGVEIDSYNPIQFPHKFGRNPSFEILSLRNHYEVYDLETILYSFKRFHNECFNSKLILAGAGDLTGSLKELALNLGISDVVEFPGRYNKEILQKLILHSSVYVSASKSDAGLAASTAECMACGLVCVVSDSGENLDWINDGINGFIFQTGNVYSLYQKLKIVYNTSSNFEKIGRAAIETIQSRNNYKIEMNKINDLYKEISNV